MTARTQAEIDARRAEVMSQLLLEELGASFVAPTSGPGFGFDIYAGYENADGGLNACVVEVKATDRPPGNRFRVPLDDYRRLAHSNLPGLLLVVDAKRNDLFHAWPQPGLTPGNDGLVPVPVRPLDDAAKADLRAVLTGAAARAAEPELAAAA